MHNIKPNKDLLTLAEKIIDQNDKIIKMNGIIIETISKPQLQIDLCTDDKPSTGPKPRDPTRPIAWTQPSAKPETPS